MEVNGYHQLVGHQHSSKYLLLCSTEETHTVSKGLFTQNASLQLKCALRQECLPPKKRSAKPSCHQTEQLPTCYCKQKLAPPLGSSDWSTVLGLKLMSSTACKSLNSAS